jgi:hypothetical protein
MKEQKVFDVVIVAVTEDLHEGSGVVKAINREVLVDEKFSAVTEESAKQKALDVAGKGVELDYDALEITCRPFCG